VFAYLSKTGLYLVNIALGGLTSLLVTVVVISVVGPDSWGRMAVAQAIGAIYAVLVGFGWGIIGPAQVAGLAEENRGQYLRDSLISRLILFVSTLPLYVGTVILLIGIQPGIVAYLVVGAVSLSVAVGSGWFFIGESAPGRLVAWDAAPRTIGALIAIGALVTTRSLLIYGIIQLAAVAVSILLTTNDLTARYPEGWYNFSIREGFSRLGDSFTSIITAGTASLYVNAPLIIVSAILPTMTPIYAAAEKIQRFALMCMSPLTQVIQGYVPSAADRLGIKERIRRSTLLATGVALVAGILIAAIMPWVARIMTSGHIAVPFSLSIPMGLSSTLILISTVTGLAALVALGRERAVATSTVVGALVGLPLTLVMGLEAGLEGVAWAVAVSEVVVLAVQVPVLMQAMRAIRPVPVISH
jgi:O-antigen/teichoic acid export membrane protein